MKKILRVLLVLCLLLAFGITASATCRGYSDFYFSVMDRFVPPDSHPNMTVWMKKCNCWPVNNYLNVSAQHITSAVKLIKSGTYFFQYIVYGAVNDNIRYNGYINTYTSITTGRFTGGYNNDGTQMWNSDITVSTNGNSYQYAITNAMSAYNSAVAEYVQNGYSYPWFPPTYGPDK